MSSSSFIHSVVDATTLPTQPLWVGWTLHGSCTAPIAGSPGQLIEATRNTNTTIQGSFQGAMRTGSTAKVWQLTASVPAGDAVPTRVSGTQAWEPPLLITHSMPVEWHLCLFFNPTPTLVKLYPVPPPRGVGKAELLFLQLLLTSLASGFSY